jgi:hypothetical protein
MLNYNFSNQTYFNKGCIWGHDDVEEEGECDGRVCVMRGEGERERERERCYLYAK